MNYLRGVLQRANTAGVEPTPMPRGLSRILARSWGRPRFGLRPGSRVICVLLLAGVLPWLISLAAGLYFGHARLVHEPLHEFLELIGACIALGVAMLLLLRASHETGALHLLWVIAALVAMGLIDGAHGVAPYGPASSWLRHGATLVGGVLFALVWLPVPGIAIRRKRSFVLLVAAVALAGSALVWWQADALPEPFLPGGYALSVKAVNGLGGVGFVAASLYFLWRYLRVPHGEDLAFASQTLLFGVAGVMFGFAHVWAADWWVWHAFRLLAYGLVLLAAYEVVAVLYRRLARHTEYLEARVEARTAELRKRQQEIAAQNEQLHAHEQEIGIQNEELQRQSEELWHRNEKLRSQAEKLAREIAERERTEASLRSVAQFPDENPYPVIRIDRHGTVLYANRSSAVLSGEWRCEAGQPAPEPLCRLVRETIQMGRIRNIDVESGGRVFAFVLTPIPASGYVNLYGRDITEHERAEEELRRNEALLRTVLDRTPDGIYLKDLDSRLLLANPATLAIIGKPAEAVLGKTDAEFYDDPATGRAIIENDRRIMSSGKIEVVEESVFDPAGTRTYLSTKAPYRDANGRIIGLIGVAREITESKRAEAALKESRERLRLAAAAARLFAFEWDPITDAVRREGDAESVLGVPFQEETGASYFARIHPEDRARFVELVHSLTPGHDSYIVSYRVLRPDGGESVLEESGRALFDDQGRFARLIGMAADITERKRVEEALRLSEEKFAKAFSGNPAAIALTRLDDGQYLEVNDTWLELHGYKREEVIGRSSLALPIWSAPEARARFAQELRAKGSFLEWEQETFTKSGESLVTQVWAQLLNVQGEQVVLSTLVDITARKRAEEDLKSAKLLAEQALAAAEAANAAKDHFLAVLSHELRTPLAPVLMTASALEGDRSVPEWLREDMAMIRRSVDLEVRLIDDLLDLNRVSRGKLELRREEVDAHAKILSAMEMCRFDSTDKALVMEIDLQARPHYVNADAGRLQQVFWNLLKNAIKFTPRGGHIKVRSSNPAPDTLRVEVEDTGMGIAPEILPQLFDAFEQGGKHVTRQFGGMGLGLAISKALVEMHGGRISGSSEGPGKGATFTVEFPLALQSKARGSQPARPAKHAKRQLRILVVEDNATTLEVLKKLLERAGHKVQVAANMREGLSLAAGNRPFDLLVSDLGLPDGDGFELMRRIRVNRPDLSGIALSGYGMEQDIQRSKDAGFAEHLVKPVELNALQAAIERVVSLHS